MIYTVNRPAKQVKLSLEGQAALRDQLAITLQTRSAVENIETIHDELLIVRVCDIELEGHELHIMQITAISVDDDTQRGYCTEYYKCLEFFERSQVVISADNLDELATKIETDILR